MTLRRQFQLYILAFHLLVLVVAAWNYEALGAWFFGIELLVLLSALLGFRLINMALKPLDFVKSFSDLLSEHEFATRFSQVGQLEMDQLIGTYNIMLRELYEERLRLGDQRGFLERFMQVTPVGVMITDFDHRISLANPAAAGFIGAGDTPLVGKTFAEVDAPLARQIDALDSGSNELLQWQGARRLRVQKQSFPDRGFDREFVLIEELTALLHESERAAYEKLIRMMSHEVNNTIASTNSLLESCRTYAPQVSEPDREDFLHALNVVITRNEHLNRFMRNFAQVVKLPAPALRGCDINELLAHIEGVFKAQLGERDIGWRRSGDTDLPDIRLDRDQMEQVLINVVKNAMEAVESRASDGLIEIRTTRNGRGVHLEILDNGTGLSPEARTELFTPFFTSKSAGQGLGLTLVKEILLRHDFEFGLGTAPDGRTCFSIRMGPKGTGPG